MLVERPTCGNGVCNSNEDCISCSKDCGCRVNQQCRFVSNAFRCVERENRSVQECIGCENQKPVDYSWMLALAVVIGVAVLLIALKKFRRGGTGEPKGMEKPTVIQPQVEKPQQKKTAALKEKLNKLEVNVASEVGGVLKKLKKKSKKEEEKITKENLKDLVIIKEEKSEKAGSKPPQPPPPS
jgi:hypothetical protein